MENFLRDSLINLLNILLFFATFNLHTEHMITEIVVYERWCSDT